MTIWILRDGVLVEKKNPPGEFLELKFPSPRISRMESYESPIDGKEITSWRQRDKDLRDSDSYDPRDAPRKSVRDERPEPQPEQLSFRWSDPD